jgi:hypothetical protein
MIFSGTANGAAPIRRTISNQQAKCPKTLGNTGLSGISAIWENAAATLLQLAMLNLQKGIVADGYDVYRKEN